jgi:hypothetical protein
MISELRLARAIVEAAVDEPPRDRTAEQQDVFEQAVASAQSRVERFEAAVERNAREIEKYAQDSRMYQHANPQRPSPAAGHVAYDDRI